ncbi:MAG: DUF1573 domain-containing protein [Niabella sp.]
MRNKLLLGVIITPLLFAIIGLLASCKTEPKISIDISNLNNQRDSIRTFTIRNIGTGKLSILDIVTSCECTALNLKKGAIIEPKDSVRVNVKINPKEQDADNMNIFVTIKTNAKPQLTSFHFSL